MQTDDVMKLASNRMSLGHLDTIYKYSEVLIVYPLIFSEDE